MADFNPQERVKKMVNAIKNEVFIFIYIPPRLEKNRSKSWIQLHNNSRLRRISSSINKKRRLMMNSRKTLSLTPSKRECILYTSSFFS